MALTDRNSFPTQPRSMVSPRPSLALPSSYLLGVMLMMAVAVAYAGEAPSGAVATPVPNTSTSAAPSDASGGASVVRQVDAPAPTAPVAATAGPGPSAPSPQSATPSPAGIGDTTRGLLNAQADGRRGAPVQPMLGSVASASYQRYVDSFKHPIPIFFGTRVETDSGQ